MTSATPLPGEAADLGGRLVALLVDGLVVALLLAPLAALTTAAGAGVPGPLEVALLWFVYRAVADGLGGSAGKRLLRLSIIGARGPQPGLGAGATRNLWSLATLLPLAVGEVVGNALALGVSVMIAVTIARAPDERGWHDRVAGTAVRRAA